MLGGAVTLAIGLATLASAIWFDMKDPTRSTRNLGPCLLAAHGSGAADHLWRARAGSGFGVR